MLLDDQPRPTQIVQGSLDSGARDVQLDGDGANSRPALALLVGVVFEVHIDHLGAVVQLGLIDLPVRP